MTMRIAALIFLTCTVLIVSVAGRYTEKIAADNSCPNVENGLPDKQEQAPHRLSCDIFYTGIQFSNPVFHAFLIFEIAMPVIESTEAHSVIDTSLNFTRYYRSLFRHIISTNAP